MGRVIPMVLMLLASAFIVSAATSLSVGNVRGHPGVTVPVPMSLRNPDDSLVGAQFDVAFNNGKVSGKIAGLHSHGLVRG